MDIVSMPTTISNPVSYAHSLSPITVSSAIGAYRHTSKYQNLAASSRYAMDNALDLLKDKFGDRTINAVRPEEIHRLRESLTPLSRYNQMVWGYNSICKHLMSRGDIETRPEAKYIPQAEVKDPLSEGYPAWTDGEFWKFFTLARPARVKLLAALGRFTGQRASDLVTVRWDDIDLVEDEITFVQRKTGEKVILPLHPELKQLLRAEYDRQEETFTDFPSHVVVDRTGQAIPANTASKEVAMEAKRLGINKSLHGLRKLMAAELAEKGATEHQIAAVTGHRSLAQVRLYTRSANQRRMASEAFKKLLG